MFFCLLSVKGPSSSHAAQQREWGRLPSNWSWKLQQGIVTWQLDEHCGEKEECKGGRGASPLPNSCYSILSKLAVFKKVFIMQSIVIYPYLKYLRAVSEAPSS